MFSPWMMRLRVRRPSVTALRLSAFFPSGVVGPVECCAFRRLDSWFLSEIIIWNYPFDSRIERGCLGNAVPRRVGFFLEPGAGHRGVCFTQGGGASPEDWSILEENSPDKSLLF